MAGAVSLLDMPWPIAVLHQHGREEIAIRTPQGPVRLSITRGSMMSGPVSVRFILEPSRLAARLQALQRWDQLVRTGSWHPGLGQQLSRPERWRLVIETLDALGAGLSLRNIATRLFGKEAVAKEWNAASDHLKLKTRRLVARAYDMLDGGYRSLL